MGTQGRRVRTQGIHSEKAIVQLWLVLKCTVPLFGVLAKVGGFRVHKLTKLPTNGI